MDIDLVVPSLKEIKLHTKVNAKLPLLNIEGT